MIRRESGYACAAGLLSHRTELGAHFLLRLTRELEVLLEHLGLQEGGRARQRPGAQTLGTRHEQPGILNTHLRAFISWATPNCSLGFHISYRRDSQQQFLEAAGGPAQT